MIFSETRRKSIWIVGSSIIRNAFVSARKSYSGIHLELDRYNTSILWQGTGGMKWGAVESKLRQLQSLEHKVPDFIMLHCGGNNIGGGGGENQVHSVKENNGENSGEL